MGISYSSFTELPVKIRFSALGLQINGQDADEYYNGLVERLTYDEVLIVAGTVLQVIENQVRARGEFY